MCGGRRGCTSGEREQSCLVHVPECEDWILSVRATEKWKGSPHQHQALCEALRPCTLDGRSETLANFTSRYYNGTVSTMDAQLPQGVIYSDVYVDVCKIADITYPSGKTVAAEVGLANLGGSPLATNLSPPGALYSSSTIQSNTFGLHIGSAQHNYPGSLIFGGYDRGRVIGPVLSFDAHTAPHLLDINIGVEDGASPFSFESKGKLLQAPDSAGVTQPISAYLKPEYPYIYLPKLTIEAIAENLPVKFDTTSGYWLWDTSDPMYKKVIGGANYLGFTFPSLTGNTANETIKVPFALLNLTLESSVSGLGSDVPYFPLMEAEVSQLTGYPILLGRAFMQATFTGTNWNTNMSWLAQAPGPGASREGLGYDPVDLGDSTQNLDVPSGDALFKESWAAHWTVLNTTDPGNGNDDNGGGGVSGGVIGGSVVAAAGGVAIIAAIIFFVMRRRKRKAASPQATQNAYHDHSPGPPAPTYAHYGDAQQPMSELHAPAQNEYYKPVPQQEQWHEMEAREYHAELPGHAPAELPASHK